MAVQAASTPTGAGDAFSYSCKRCGKCCYGKRIQINPYEVARLSRRLSLTTAAFREQHTFEGAGAYLRQTDDGACVFFGPEGCTVHADRPLVCRLYPLGRHIDETGAVRFSTVDLTPPPGGVFGQDGVVAGYLTQQGAEVFARYADAYFAWYCEASRQLETGSEAALAENASLPEGDLLDLDDMVDRHAAETGAPAPTDLEARAELHLEILYRLISADRPAWAPPGQP